jgi:hypothetical protein
MSYAHKSGLSHSVVFYLANARHRFDFILLTDRKPNEMPQTESDRQNVTLEIYKALPHTVKVEGVLACHKQREHAPTGIPNITNHLTLQNTFCTAKYRKMT